MYDNVWFKDIKEVNLASGNQGSGLNDLAVVELSEAIEPEYVKPACFAWRKGGYNYSGPLLVGHESRAWLFNRLILNLITNKVHWLGANESSFTR